MTKCKLLVLQKIELLVDEKKSARARFCEMPKGNGGTMETTGTLLVETQRGLVVLTKGAFLFFG